MTRMGQVLRTGLSAPIVLMVTKVYVPVLFPLTFLIALTATRLDEAFGFQDGFLPVPLNLVLAAASFVVGFRLVLTGVRAC